MAAMEEMRNASKSQAASLICHSKQLEDDILKLGLRIKQHEENITFLKAQSSRLDDSIRDMQVSLGKYQSPSEPVIENEALSHVRSEEETIECIMKHWNSAAGILCQLQGHPQSQVSNLPWMKDVLGVVATLGKVEDDNFSRLLSEFLGLETMLAVVCKTHDCVKAMETYDREGFINNSSGLHGLGASIGRSLDGHFLVICLENLRPYFGDFIANDPQRRLDLIKPKLPSGETPPGFIGFAVNMINIDNANLSFVTTNGQGLRETLFYHLLSRLQVYRTRDDMLRALPLISNGALSLDGGMIKSNGVFYLGNGRDIGVKFPKSSGRSLLPGSYYEIENAIKFKKWEKERLLEDLRREQSLLDQIKFNYEIKKQEFVKFLAERSLSANQNLLQSGRERLTPR